MYGSVHNGGLLLLTNEGLLLLTNIPLKLMVGLGTTISLVRKE